MSVALFHLSVLFLTCFLNFCCQLHSSFLGGLLALLVWLESSFLLTFFLIISVHIPTAVAKAQVCRMRTPGLLMEDSMSGQQRLTGKDQDMQ